MLGDFELDNFGRPTRPSESNIHSDLRMRI